MLGTDRQDGAVLRASGLRARGGCQDSAFSVSPAPTVPVCSDPPVPALVLHQPEGAHEGPRPCDFTLLVFLTRVGAADTVSDEQPCELQEYVKATAGTGAWGRGSWEHPSPALGRGGQGAGRGRPGQAGCQRGMAVLPATAPGLSGWSYR